ncbi:MAG TPA: ABC transporter permease subunit, partial [Myxococcota bacterium]|nr:ABC transporter permease subunit [Myxococcota bacterium]
MIPAHFPMMVVAELRKTFSKGSGIAALIVALLVGILTAAAVYQVQHMEGASINGTSVSELVTVDAVQIAGYALRVRNFFVLPMFLVLGMAGSVAGELSDRTLRELLVRPVSRASVLFAKLTASGILSLITLTLTLLPAFALGALLFGLPKEEVSSQILKVL